MITQNRKGRDKGWAKTSFSLFFNEVMSATFFSSSSETNIEDTWEKIDIKVATSSNMGYGLYEKCMKDIKEYLKSE